MTKASDKEAASDKATLAQDRKDQRDADKREDAADDRAAARDAAAAEVGQNPNDPAVVAPVDTSPATRDWVRREIELASHGLTIDERREKNP